MDELVAEDDEVIRLGPRGVPYFLREAGRAIRGHVGERAPGTLSRAEVVRYFEARSAAGDSFGDVIDSSSRTYQRLLESSAVRTTLAATDSAAGILDYGCGRGALRQLLAGFAPTHHYFGYDIDRRAVEQLRRNQPSEYGSVSSTLPDREFGAVFVVNVLVYTAEAELDVVLAEVVSRLRPGGNLIVVEPWPAWYWETRFDGLRLRLRTRREIATRCADRGLTLVSGATLSLFGSRVRPVLPIAWLGVWQQRIDIQLSS